MSSSHTFHKVKISSVLQHARNFVTLICALTLYCLLRTGVVMAALLLLARYASDTQTEFVNNLYLVTSHDVLIAVMAAGLTWTGMAIGLGKFEEEIMNL